jgi:hypothetical protein
VKKAAAAKKAAAKKPAANSKPGSGNDSANAKVFAALAAAHKAELAREAKSGTAKSAGGVTP